MNTSSVLHYIFLSILLTSLGILNGMIEQDKVMVQQNKILRLLAKEERNKEVIKFYVNALGPVIATAGLAVVHPVLPICISPVVLKLSTAIVNQLDKPLERSKRRTREYVESVVEVINTDPTAFEGLKNSFRTRFILLLSYAKACPENVVEYSDRSVEGWLGSTHDFDLCELRREVVRNVFNLEADKLAQACGKRCQTDHPSKTDHPTLRRRIVARRRD